MAIIQNPILTGFNPDPSILRVGEDYYIATSTFEWFPGVQIHHSRDLVNWELIARPLDRLSQLDMLGNVDSGGIWAPCLSYTDGVFYLVYTDMKSWRGMHKEGYNYVVTASDIHGPWSEPIFLTASGFDPSFYHEDGKSYLLHLMWDFRHTVRPEGFYSIVLQEFDRSQGKLVGPVHKLMKSTELGSMEGPHLYKRNGYYYLMTAEGGTEYSHAVTMGRSKNLTGPYELDPENPMLSAFNHPELDLQKAGHASLVETQTGEWYLAHLCGRPLASKAKPDEKKWCILGRETALQLCAWSEEGWLRLAQGGRLPDTHVPGLKLRNTTQTTTRKTSSDMLENFDSDKLNIHFQSLRIPMDESWCKVDTDRQRLILKGQGPLTSHHRQSLVARRLQHFQCEITTAVKFFPTHFHAMAGLTLYYDTSTHYYLHVTYDENVGRCLKMMSVIGGKHTYYHELTTPLNESHELVYLKATVDHNKIIFLFSSDAKQWVQVGEPMDSTYLSDDFARLGFTGAFAGMAVQDLRQQDTQAEFDYFHYRKC